MKISVISLSTCLEGFFYILRFWLRNREIRYVKKTVELSQFVDYEERQKGLS